jgi:hypothetical protein
MVRQTFLGDRLGVVRPRIALAVLPILAAVPIALSLALVPRTAALPFVSLSAFALAALVALVAWTCNMRRHGDRVTLWDVSGALAFIGCAAAMLSGPDNVLQLFGIAMVR